VSILFIHLDQFREEPFHQACTRSITGRNVRWRRGLHLDGDIQSESQLKHDSHNRTRDSTCGARAGSSAREMERDNSFPVREPGNRASLLLPPSLLALPAPSPGCDDLRRSHGLTPPIITGCAFKSGAVSRGASRRAADRHSRSRVRIRRVISPVIARLPPLSCYLWGSRHDAAPPRRLVRGTIVNECCNSAAGDNLPR